MIISTDTEITFDNIQYPLMKTLNILGIKDEFSTLIKDIYQNLNHVEGVEKREPSYAVDGNVNRYNHYGKQ